MNPIIVQAVPHIQGVLKIKVDKFFDHRGSNWEGFNKSEYEKAHPFFRDVDFKIDSFSYSHFNVLRGFHGDNLNHKLIQVLYGAIQFVVIDMRPSSATYFNVLDMNLDALSGEQILVPAGCVNAHLCLSDSCVFAYKLSNSYALIKDQIHIKWYDKRFNIDWKSKHPILSDRDR